MTVSGTSGSTTLPATTDPTPSPGTVTDQGRVKPDGTYDTSPDHLGFFETLGRSAVHAGSLAGDATSLFVQTDDNGPSLRGNGLPILGLMGGNAAVAGLIALKHSHELPAGQTLSTKAILSDTGNQFMINGIRVTPTIVSAIVGPALADGVSYVAPKLIPKYKSTMKPGEKSQVQIERAVVAAAAVGIGAAVAFLIKPDLFKSAGFLSDMARNGGSEVVEGASPALIEQIKTAGGVLGNSSSIRGVLSLNENGQVIRTLAATARDGVFANRATIALVGGLGTAYLGYRTATADNDGERVAFGAATAVAGALTLGGIKFAPQLTRGATEATRVAMLPSGGLLPIHKPNIQWIKEFASKIVPVTASPAGMSAYSYLDIFNDFDQITGPRSPFKGK